jgi:large subunit ribosomal protein L3
MVIKSGLKKETSKTKDTGSLQVFSCKTTSSLNGLRKQRQKLMKAFITHKLGMISTVDDNGKLQAVTLLSAKTNTITQVKTVEKDGYAAVQVGTGNNKKHGKTQLGHLKASKVTPKFIREFRLKDDSEEVLVGQELPLDSFVVGDVVSATATTKGKGWAGTIKRHNFHRGRKTHGGRSYRRPGSIGSMYPQKIFKGKRMAGQMGHTQVTTRGLKVALIDAELGVIGVTGAVPGPKKGLVLIKGTK